MAGSGSVVVGLAAWDDLGVTPWYQLTRLVWWPGSPFVASALFGLVSGLVLAGLTVAGVFQTSGISGNNATGAITFGVVFGFLQGARGVWVCRRRWAELEVLSDWERARLIHVVHFGEDPGTTVLAAATVEFAAWKRSQAEQRWNRTGGIVAATIVAIFVGFHAIDYFLAADVARGALGVSVAGSAGLVAWQLYRGQEARRRNLWNAEWYSRQRLDRLAS